MRLSDAELSLICERSCNLSERLSGQYLPVVGDPTIGARRLKRWQQLSGQNVQRQLAAVAPAAVQKPITQDHLAELLGPVKRASGMHLPAWTTLLNEIVGAVASFSDYAASNGSSKPVPRGVRRIPFEHLYWPVAEFAWNQVVSEHPRVSAQLGSRTAFGLKGSLVRRLAGILSNLLHPAFLAHKSLATSSMKHHFFGEKFFSQTAMDCAKNYSSFIAERGEDGMATLFTEFPVAARLVAEVTQAWIDFVGEFLDRLLLDAVEIARRFAGDSALGKLNSVRANLSDPHRGGRSVLLLTFEGGMRLVYKPRPMGIDHQFYALIQAINTANPRFVLSVLKIWDRGTYGWMECARHQACPDQRAARRYFRRAGALACLAHWLKGIDFHRENLVAAGEQPLLLDL